MLFSDVESNSHEVGSNLEIDFAGGGSVTLTSMPLASLTSGWFVFD